MLNIPESIKTLFKTDGVRKNFRAHFPNGEYSDITNSDVVAESLRFSESLCSQKPFKFGCAEASVLEFETVGRGNMYGMTIEAGIEIDTSSLSAADISTIQAGTWDGTLVLAADSDIGYGFFRVPLGVFRVESCPRNHGAMTHRQVTAYSAQITTRPVENAKLQQAYKTPDYTPDIRYLVNSLMGDTPADSVTLVDTIEWSDMEPGEYSGTMFMISYPSEYTYVVRLQSSAPFTGKRFLFDGGVATDTGRSTPDNALFSVFMPEGATLNFDYFFDWVIDAMAQEGKTLTYDDVLEHIRLLHVPIISFNGGFAHYKGSGSSIVKSEGAYVIKGDTLNFYPYVADGIRGSIVFPAEFTLELEKLGRGIISTHTFDLYENASGKPYIEKYEFTNARPTVKASFPATAIYSDGQTSFTKAYDAAKIVSGMIETRGEFFRVDRATNSPEIVELDDSSPISIFAGEYADMWWDEYNIAPIGEVIINSLDEKDKENTAVVEIGAGSSVYDMTDNELLKSIYGESLQAAASIIETDFAPRAGGVMFTPVELTMKGYPWIEAGDALEITAEDGTIVKTFALRVEYSGIQNFTAHIVSENGEIIEEY